MHIFRFYALRKRRSRTCWWRRSHCGSMRDLGHRIHGANVRFFCTRNASFFAGENPYGQLCTEGANRTTAASVKPLEEISFNQVACGGYHSAVPKLTSGDLADIDRRVDRNKIRSERRFEGCTSWKTVCVSQLTC